MKTRKIVITLALCFFAVALSAAENPNVGTWKLNDAKSKIPAGVPKNTMVVYSAAAGDMIKVTTDGVDGAGKPTHSEWTGKFDGKPYPVTGTSGYDARAVTAKGDRTLDIDNMMGGKSVGKAKVELAKDGKSRTLEADGKGPDGKAYKAKFVYDKQ
jgi:hypothetical protein